MWHLTFPSAASEKLQLATQNLPKSQDLLANDSKRYCTKRERRFERGGNLSHQTRLNGSFSGWGVGEWEHCPFKRVEGLPVIERIHPLDFVAAMHSLGLYASLTANSPPLLAGF